MKSLHRVAPAWTIAAIAILAAVQDVATQQPGAVSVNAGYGTGVDALRRWDETVDRLTRTGGLVLTSRRGDRARPGRTHEYLAQAVDGVPVLGGGVSRQLDAAGVTVSLLGTLHRNIDIGSAPALSAADAAAGLERARGGRIVAGPRPALVVLPLPDGSYALSYRIPMSDGRFYFADASDGRILHAADAIRSQAAVGSGSSSRGRRKKLSTTRDGIRFLAHDHLRPAEIVTLDAKFNRWRIGRLISEHFEKELAPGVPVWNANDVAADADNEWDDPAVVETHAHTGWTYDYLDAQHGWQGLDGADGRIFSIVNLEPDLPNAFAIPPPFGPEGSGVFVYGRAASAAGEEPFSSLDIVAHELMHGVTHFAVSKRTGDPLGLQTDLPSSTRLGPETFTVEEGVTFACDNDFWWCIDGRFLLASAQGGAVNEAYSDIVAESVGFFHEDAGATADYLVGKDQTFGPLRSLADPGSISILGDFADFPYPDAYQNRYEFVLARSASTGVTNPDPLLKALDLPEIPEGWTYSHVVFVNGRFAFSLSAGDYGGDHWNSTILSHAFYLAIEGGTNRTTGLSVQGVGDAGRAAVERIFFRGMTNLMPAATSLPLTASAIRQAAADLAPGGEAQRAVTQALTAVGLPSTPPAATVSPIHDRRHR